MIAGVDGLLRDKTRPSRIPPLPPEIAERVVALTLGPPSGETTHRTAPAMASQVGISISSVQRIWRGHGLQPHRLRQFKLSNDPHFAAKLRDIGTSSASTSIHLPTPLCCRSTKRAKSRRLTILSRDCLSSVAGAAL
jgi:hypothetical protein